MRILALFSLLFLVPLFSFGSEPLLPAGVGELSPQEIQKIKEQIPDMKARAKWVLKGLAEEFADALAEMRTEPKQLEHAPIDTYRAAEVPIGSLREKARVRAQRAYLTALLLQNELIGDQRFLKTIVSSEKTKHIAKAGAPLLLAGIYTSYLLARYGLMPWYPPIADLPDYVDLYVKGWISNINLTVGGLHVLVYVMSWQYRSWVAQLTDKVFARKTELGDVFMKTLKRNLEKRKLRVATVTPNEMHLRIALEDEIGLETGCISALVKP